MSQGQHSLQRVTVLGRKILKAYEKKSQRKKRKTFKIQEKYGIRSTRVRSSRTLIVLATYHQKNTALLLISAEAALSLATGFLISAYMEE